MVNFPSKSDVSELNKKEKKLFCKTYDYFSNNYKNDYSYNKFTADKVAKELQGIFYEGWLLILLERKELDPTLYAEKMVNYPTKTDGSKLNKKEKRLFCKAYDYFRNNYKNDYSYNKFTTYCKDKVADELQGIFYEGCPTLYAEKLREYKVL